MLILLTVLTIAIWYALDYFYVPKLLVNEPPLVPHSIPYVGHILGLLRCGTRYYETMRYVSVLVCWEDIKSANPLA